VNSGHTLFFRASSSCSKVLKDKKYFNTVKSFRARKLFKNLNDKKSVTGCQGRQGREFLPYHNHEMCKTNEGSKITNWIQICPFTLKRCNYCMILIIFIVNTSGFAYFFFSSGESHEGRQRLLVLLSPRGFRLNRIEQFVTNCGGERLPCNYLYVSSVTFMSVTVQCLYTLLINICTLSSTICSRIPLTGTYLTLCTMQCLSTGCIVHPRVYQNFPGVYHWDGVYQMCVLQEQSHRLTFNVICVSIVCQPFTGPEIIYGRVWIISFPAYLLVMLVKWPSRILHRRIQGNHGHPKFLAYLAILCFEKRRPKPKYSFSPKSQIFWPPRNFGLATPLVSFFIKCRAVGSPQVEKVGNHYSSLNFV